MSNTVIAAIILFILAVIFFAIAVIKDKKIGWHNGDAYVIVAIMSFYAAVILLLA